MKRLMSFTIIVFLLFAVQLVPAQEEAKETKWHEVITFSGKSTRNTKLFEVSSAEWRIKWDTTPIRETDGVFSIAVYDSSGYLQGMHANVVGADTDESYIYTPGTYYLEIASTQNYIITVEEMK